VQGVDILGDEIDGGQHEEDAEDPGAGADDGDGVADGGGIRKHAGQDGRGAGAGGLDEAFDGLGGGSNLGQGDIIHGGDDVGAGKGHEEGRDAHEDAKDDDLRVGGLDGQEEADHTHDDADLTGDKASAFVFFEEFITQPTASGVSGGHQQNGGPHDHQGGGIGVAAFHLNITEDVIGDDLPGEDAGEALGVDHPKAFLFENLAEGFPVEFLLDDFHPLQFIFTAAAGDILDTKVNDHGQKTFCQPPRAWVNMRAMIMPIR
jgi:hypothetical protein